MAQKPKMLREIPNAAEACKHISSKADEIKAAANGAANVISSVLGFLSPRNYKSENESSQQIKNNYNTDLSSEDIKKIRNSCENVTSNVQSNTIDLSKCEFCQTNRCQVKNITQRNAAQSSAECTINSLIDTLTQKQASIDSMGLLKVIQDAKGMSSGNTSNTNICNNVNTDMSTSQYFENISSCANKTIGKQTNYLASCGDVMDVVQDNSIVNFSKCMNDAMNTASTKIGSETKTSFDIANNQKSEFSLFSFSPFMMYSSCIVCCVISLIISIACYFLKSSSNK